MENLSYKLIPIFNPILPSQFPIPPKISNFNFLAIPYNKSLNPLNLKIKKTLLKNGWYTLHFASRPLANRDQKYPAPATYHYVWPGTKKNLTLEGGNVGIPVRTPFLMNIETRT